MLKNPLHKPLLRTGWPLGKIFPDKLSYHTDSSLSLTPSYFYPCLFLAKEKHFAMPCDIFAYLFVFLICNSSLSPIVRVPSPNHGSPSPLIKIILLNKFLFTEEQTNFYLTVQSQGLAWGIRWEVFLSPNASTSNKSFPYANCERSKGKIKLNTELLSQRYWLQSQDPA